MGSKLKKASADARRKRKTRERVSQLQEEEADRIVLAGKRAAAAKQRKLLKEMDRMQQGQTKKKGALWKWREKRNLNAPDAPDAQDAPAYLKGKNPPSSGKNAPSREDTAELIKRTKALRALTDKKE